MSNLLVLLSIGSDVVHLFALWLRDYILDIKSSTIVRQLFKSDADYVSRRFNEPSAELRSSWG